MKKYCVMSGDPIAIAMDMRKLFKFKITKVMPCDVPMKNGDLEEGVIVAYKTTKKNYKNYLETRNRYGF